MVKFTRLVFHSKNGALREKDLHLRVEGFAFESAEKEGGVSAEIGCCMLVLSSQICLFILLDAVMKWKLQARNFILTEIQIILQSFNSNRSPIDLTSATDENNLQLSINPS